MASVTRETVAERTREIQELARFPTSAAQRRFRLLDQIDAANGTWNFSARYQLSGPIRFDVLQQAFNALLARHDILRTSLHLQGGELIQIVRRKLESSIVLAPAGADEEAATLAQCHAPFTLSVPPLLRATLFPRAPEEHVLLIAAHGAILDDWSAAILIEELRQLYAARENGETAGLPQSVQFSQYLSRLHQLDETAEFQSHRSYWNAKLARLPQFEVLTDKPRPADGSFAGESVSAPLPAVLSKALRESGVRESVSLFALFSAALNVLLHRFTGETEIAVGTELAGRDSVEREGIVGALASEAVLAAEIQPACSLRQVLAAARDELTEVLSHQSLPLESILETAAHRRGARGMLYTVGATYLPHCMRASAVPGGAGFRSARLPLARKRARVDLDFTLSERDGGGALDLCCVYKTELFERETVERMLACLTRVLEAFAGDLDRAVAEVELIGADERQKVLSCWNSATAASYPKEACVHQLIEAQVVRTPDATAAVFADQRLTYAGLNARANQLARHLQTNGVRPGDRAGILLDRSMEMLVAVLAVMKSGASYVPLDPAYPKERLAYMTEQAKLRALLTVRTLRDELAPAGSNSICLDDAARQIDALPGDNLNLTLDSGGCAYILFTSGSTGAPKGVQIAHRNFVNLLCSVREISGISPRDVMLAIATLCFDISGTELILPLLAGAQVVIAPRDMTTDARRLRALVSGKNVTMMQATPALWRMLIDSGWQGGRHLTVFTCGEALAPDLAAALVARSAAALNLYGPTETTVYSTVSRLSGPRVTIGRPVANTQIYILDEKLRPQPIGVPGELYIAGDGVGLGYLNRPELTADRFGPNPFSTDPRARWYRTGDRARFLKNGEIEFLGRSDDQLKVRGFRIEPAEIETVLRQHASVLSCVVTARDDNAGYKRLVAYIVPQPNAAVRSAELRTFAARRLPEYMIPNAFVQLEKLPLTPSGKINRRALPALESMHAAEARPVEHPNNPVEAEIAQIWEDLLNVRPVGIHDDFFALGGHSLLAVRMMALIERVYRRQAPLADFFSAPTVQSLAAALLSRCEKSRETPLVRIKEGRKPPFYFLHGDILGGGLYCWNLARHLDAERPFYIIPPQGLESDPLLPSIQAVAAYHLQFIREAQPHGPYCLGGTCNGGIIAFEAAQQLRDAGEDVASLVIIDAPADNARHRLLYRCVRTWDWLLRRAPEESATSFRRWRERVLKLRAYLRRAPREQLSRSTRRLRKLFAGDPCQPEDESGVLMLRDSLRTPEGRQALLKYYRVLLEGYVPKRYSGPVDLLFSREPGEAEELTPGDKVWYKIVRNPRVQFITGRHATFTTRNLPALAACLNRALS